jgi:hypothetical protein
LTNGLPFPNIVLLLPIPVATAVLFLGDLPQLAAAYAAGARQ